MKRIINKASKGFRKIFISPLEQIYLKILQRKLPIINNMIVFETEGDYWDNGRAFYEYLIENQLNEKYQIVWFVHDPQKYNCPQNVRFISRFHYGINFRAMKIIAQAKCFLFTHPWWLKDWRSNQVVVNLTHSTMQLKAAGSDVSDCFDYILCASVVAKRIKSITYHAKENQMIILGSPRNDLLTRKTDIASLIPDYADEKIILCMTTFRQSVGNWNDSNMLDTYSLNVVHSEEELEALNVFLLQNNSILIVKIHHLQNTNFLKNTNLSNIFYLKDSDLASCGMQLYELLGNSDILLTDYSSVFYDYLLLNRPIGFLVGDLKQYTRGFCVENPLEAMPGEKIFNFNQLLEFITRCFEDDDNYRNIREKLCNEVHFYKDKHCYRLLTWLETNVFNI